MYSLQMSEFLLTYYIMSRVLESSEDSIMIQNDIDSLFEWENLLQMSFNLSKCCIMHVSHEPK